MNDAPTLSHGVITLRPLVLEDAPAFRALTDDAAWRGMSVPLPADDEAMATHLSRFITAADVLAFAVEQRGEFVGMTTYYDIVPGMRVEIGNTLYGRNVWGTHVNPTCKYLLLDHAFTAMGMHRVALRCDHRNTRSHGAIARLGAVFEGTLRGFRPAADGSIADVDYFSILANEWPAVRAELEPRLAPAV